MSRNRFIETIVVQLALMGITIAPLVIIGPAKSESQKGEPVPAIGLERSPVKLMPSLQPVPSQSPAMPRQFILDEKTCPDDGCICISDLDDRGRVMQMKCSPTRQYQKKEDYQ
jgi:hypothetical protein